MRMKCLALLLAVCFLLPAVPASLAEEASPAHIPLYGIQPLPAEDIITGSSTAGDADVPQLTMEEIQAMNPDKPVLAVFSNNGYLSFLLGKYYEEPVQDAEDGIASIQAMASLLGFGKGCEFFTVYASRHKTGYTFYTYQQRFGQRTLRNATLKIIVDPMGYTAGLSCSFTPNAGTASRDPAITPEEALEIVRSRMVGQDLDFYPEHTVREIAVIDYAACDCYLVYTSNPDASGSFDMPYLEHFVAVDGEYIYGIPASTFTPDRKNIMDNRPYFEGFEMHEYTRTVTLQDGSERTVTVPVGYNPNDGLYYLVDPEREIAVADYYDFNYADKVTFITSETVDGWTQNNLMAYANVRIVYDFYASHGIRSIDGFGTPILVTVNWMDKNLRPVDNASFYGINRGWACFGFSNVNHYCDSLDVVAHEYTHGILRLSVQGVLSINETGAINEAFADIMGNLAEMSLGYTDDQEWKIAEKSGNTLRNMSKPNEMEQPAFVGDRYYKSPVTYPDSSVNDSGGIHRDSALVGHIAWRMSQSGMAYDQQISMWLLAMEILTSRSDYTDLHAALLLSLRINGLMDQYGSALNGAFEDSGLNEDWRETYLTATREDCGRVTFDAWDLLADLPCQVNFFDVNQNYRRIDYAYPDPEGRISALLPEGLYVAQISLRASSGATEYYNYTGKDWLDSADFFAFSIKPGKVVRLTYDPEE